MSGRISRRAFLAVALGGMAGAALHPAMRAGAQEQEAVNPFLLGNFAPVEGEIAADDLPVIGVLPPELNGLFARNGPNPRLAPKRPYHWYDGDGMLHAVRFRDGKAAYFCRYVQTRGWLAEKAAGKAIWGGIRSVPPLLAPPEGMLFKNAANTALVWHAGKLLALWEQGEPYEITLPALETVGPYTFDGMLRGAFTGHPKIDPITGEMLAFGYDPNRAPYLTYHVIDAAGALVHRTPIDIPRAVMMHDFAITARYTIFLDLPFLFDPAPLLGGQAPLRFDSRLPARIGILPRHAQGSVIRWFEAQTCYAFHTVNAWESGDRVVLLAARMPGASLHVPPRDTWKNRAVLHRWTFDLKTGTVEESVLDDTGIEFPRLNEAFIGQAGRYAYAARMVDAPDEMLRFDGLIKYDLENGQSVHHALGAGRFGGEAVFATRPGAKAEDDGWLITCVYNAETDRSECLVIDAARLDDAPLARVMLPRRVPYGFHGIWLGEQNNGRH